MKQFSLDEYLKNPSKKVVTRDGRNVKIYCTNYAHERSIIAEIEGTGISESFAGDGKYYTYESSKNDLFFAPEKETEEHIITRDNIPLNWSCGKLNAEKFDVSTLAPFNKVLTRNNLDDMWRPNFFGYINNAFQHRNISCFGFCWKYCIPYNEETKHLVGTSDDCPEHYKW